MIRNFKDSMKKFKEGKINRLIYTKLFLVIISFVLVFIAGANAAKAATLYFSPTSGSYDVGQAFSINVFVSSHDQAMNAASGIVSFPADKLEVASLSKGGSIISLWVLEPTFSNSAGTINFEGIVLNPGFTGSAGKIITINFKTKSAGDASLIFSSGTILANDGQGTNILTGMGSGSYTISSKAIVPKKSRLHQNPSQPLLLLKSRKLLKSASRK